MSRFSRILLAALFAVAIALLSGLFWLLGTNAGARWAFAEISARAPGSLTARDIQGTLAGNLVIFNLRLSWSSGEAEVERVIANWDPGALLTGQILFRKLSLANVRIGDRTVRAADQRSSFTWPEPVRLPGWLNVRVKRFQIQGLRYESGAEEPFILMNAEADLLVRPTSVRIKDLSATTADHSLAGSFSTSLVKPRVALNVSLKLGNPAAGFTGFSLAVDLNPARDPLAGAGQFTLTAHSSSIGEAVLTGQVSVKKQSIAAKDILLRFNERSGRITGNLEVDLRKAATTFALRLGFSDLNLKGEGIPIGNLNGTLNVTGSPETYRGTVSAVNTSDSWQAFRLNAGFEGTPGRVLVSLRDSRIFGEAVQGSAEIRLERDNLLIDQLALSGKGFSVQAAGSLQEKISLSAKVAEIGEFVPEASGSAGLSGWISRRSDRFSGHAEARVENIQVNGFSAKRMTVTASAGEGKDMPFSLDLRMNDAGYGPAAASSVTVSAAGTLSGHKALIDFSGDNTRLHAELEGGLVESNAAWRGRIVELSGRDGIGAWKAAEPAELLLSRTRFTLSPLVLAGKGSERLEVAAEITESGIKELTARWTGLELERANPWLAEIRVRGTTTGALAYERTAERTMKLTAKVSGQGSLTMDQATIAVEKSSMELLGNQGGIEAEIEIELAGDQRLSAGFSSDQPLSDGVPDQGSLKLELSEFDLAALGPWLPASIGIKGALTGELRGTLLPDKQFTLTGSLLATNGFVRYEANAAELRTEVERAEVGFEWSGRNIQAKYRFDLGSEGSLEGAVGLPLVAQVPPRIIDQGALSVIIKGTMNEQGMLTALFPGLIRESTGLIDVDANIDGTWRDPQFSGTLGLREAGGYFPPAGITVTNVGMTVRLREERVEVDSFQAESGGGSISGQAVIVLDGWEITRFSGSVQGKAFRAVNLPEFRMAVTPALSFEGAAKKLEVTGEVLIPSLLVREIGGEGVVQPSDDVVVIGREQEPGQDLPFDPEIHIRVILGDQVLVKAAGADARLEGSFMLNVDSKKDVTATGRISVSKGRYSAYGVTLDIARGNIVFAGGPVDNPTLDILALKTTGDVSAGVNVTGTLEDPVVRLYSDPPMPDSDILSYIVLGYPLGRAGGNEEEQSALMRAAGLLLSQSRSVVLQEQLKNRLGIDTLDIQTGAGDVSRSLVTIGKYLNPRLYVSYGISLFSGENLFRLRYAFSRHWELETRSGETSGADLYYTITFD